jgi:hypothetical protein
VRRIGYLWLAAGALAVVASPIAGYWLIGDQSSPGFPDEQLDFVMTPPDWPDEAVKAAGAVALSIVLGAVLLLGWAARQRRIDPRWITVVGLLITVGAIVAGGYRTVTAGVIGANIGAGFVFLFGIPACIALIGWAAVAGRRIIANDHT